MHAADTSWTALRAAAWLMAAVAVAHPPAAAADDATPSSYRAAIDRVDLEPDSLGGLRLRVGLSALALQGQLLPLTDPRSIRLTVGGSKLEAPFSIGAYGATGSETAIVIVLQANLAYAEALPAILSTLDDVVLSTLGDRTQLAVLSYGEASGAGKLASLKSTRGKLSQISPDGSAGEPALIDTLERALLLLKKAKTTPEGRPLRKLIVAIGDGRDRSGDRERVTQLGVRADRQGVRIHTLGYAPSNVRPPLLTLGELSKRSLGTYRWVRGGAADSWSGAFQQLRDEINKQYVLTYFLPPDAEVAGKKLKIAIVGRTEATSNELKVPEPACGKDPCAGYCVDGVCATPREASGRGVLGWLLLVGGVVVGALVVLGLIGWAIQKRQQAAARPPLPGLLVFPGQAPGQLPTAGQPGMPFPPGIKPPKPAKQKRGKAVSPVAPMPVQVIGPVLMIMTGPRTGERIPLQNGFTIGKAPTSHLVLDDGYTSSQHAQLGVDPLGVVRLYDRNSTNGTYVNGVRVTEVVLDHGMSVRIGSIELRYLAQ